MGQITSDTWLDVGFGEALKQFFLDHFKIHAVIWYDVRAFEKALVGTCITILEKEDESEEARENNAAKFVRIKKAMPTEEIVRTIETAKEDFEDEHIGVTLKKQKEREPKDKWGIFLRAPTIYFKIKENKKMAKLGELAKVNYAIKTGANEFFYLDKEKVKLWGIEKKFLEPLVSSPKNIGIEIHSKDADESVLMVHEPKDKLKDTNVLKYIEHGETVETRIKGGKKDGTIVKGYQNLSSVKSRKLWYDLGKREAAPSYFLAEFGNVVSLQLTKRKLKLTKLSMRLDLKTLRTLLFSLQSSTLL